MGPDVVAGGGSRASVTLPRRPLLVWRPPSSRRRDSKPRSFASASPPRIPWPVASHTSASASPAVTPPPVVSRALRTACVRSEAAVARLRLARVELPLAVSRTFVLPALNAFPRFALRLVLPVLPLFAFTAVLLTICTRLLWVVSSISMYTSNGAGFALCVFAAIGYRFSLPPSDGILQFTPYWSMVTSKVQTDVDGLVEVTEKDQLCCYLFKSHPRYLKIIYLCGL